MFINIIDKFISNFIDNFYLKKIKTSKIKNDDSIINVVNIFYDSNINSILKIFEITVTKLDNQLRTLICKYLIHYYYLYFFINKIGKNIDKDLELIKVFFSKKFNANNNDYYNQDTNSQIIKYITLSYDIIHKLKNKEHLFHSPESSILWVFINNQILDKIKSNLSHNVIKIILLKYHHIQNREQIFYSLIKQSDENYKDIEIVVTKGFTNITYSLIEHLFNITDHNKINRLFDFINENNKTYFKIPDKSKNFQYLINSKVIYLIVDDFLRYHKDNFKYDAEYLTQNVDKKSKRRINIAVDRTQKVAKLYNELTPKEKEELLIIMNNRLRKSIMINDIDEVQIIKRIHDEGKNKIDNEYYEDLLKIRKQPYNNFDNFKYSGITTKMEKSIKLIRYCSLEYIKSGSSMKSSSSLNTDTTIQMRNSGKNNDCNIIGFYIPSNNQHKFNINNIIINNEINTDLINKLLIESMRNKLKKSNAFIFKENLNTEFITNLFNNIYTKITNQIFNKIIHILELKSYTEIYDYLQILDIYSTKYIQINYNKNLYNQFINIIYNKNYIKDTKYKFDPNQKKTISYIVKKIKRDFNNIDKTQNSVCQHIIDWKEIKQMNQNTELYSHLQFEFIKKYVQHEYDGDQVKNIICKSCNQLLNLWNFVAEGTYDENNNFITFYTSKYTQLTELNEYAKYINIIEYLNKQIDKISDFFDLSYHGHRRIQLRDNRIKDCITLLKFNFFSMKHQLNDKKLFVDYIKKFNIDATNLFPIDIDLVNISTFTKKDDEKSTHDKIFINNFNSYMVGSIIFNITNIDIIFIKSHTKFNIKSFEKVKNRLFENCNIITDFHLNTTSPILNYNVLCYIIFILSSYIFASKLWYSIQGEKNIKTHIEIIHTIVDILNRLILIKNNTINIISNHFSINDENFKTNLSRLVQIYRIKFLKNLKELFSSNKIYKQIHINYAKQQIDKEISATLGEVGQKYHISNIPKMITCYYHNIQPIFYNFFTKKYKINKNIFEKKTPWKMNNSLIDRIYFNMKDILCKTKQLDFCKIETVDKHNRLNIYKYWKKYQTDLNVIKTHYLDSRMRSNYIYKKYIDDLFNKKKDIKINDYIYNFCKFIKTKIYQKYRKDINIDTDQYSMNFLYNLKIRKNKLYINQKDIVETQNITKNTPDRTILLFNSKKDKIHYFFNKKNLGFIAYKIYNKELVEIDTTVYRYFLIPENSFFTKLKYAGIDIDNISKLETIKGNVLHNQIITQFTIIKKYIRQLLKYIYIIRNDKTLLINQHHEYKFLSIYLKDYNISSIHISNQNTQTFKNWNYIFKKDIDKIDNLKIYTDKYNYPIYYFIHELFKLLELNNNQQSEICYFIFNILNDIILKDNLSNIDFKQKVAQYFIEIEQTNSDRFFRNQLGDENFKNYQETTTQSDQKIEEPEVQEDGYDMMDNDNDEDDMMESEMN